MPSERSMQLAAQAWTTPSTSGRVMDHTLAIAFATILEDVLQSAESAIKAQKPKIEKAKGEMRFTPHGPNINFYEQTTVSPESVYFIYAGERESLRRDSDIEDAILISEKQEKTPPYIEGGTIEGAPIHSPPIQDDLFAGDALPDNTLGLHDPIDVIDYRAPNAQGIVIV